MWPMLCRNILPPHQGRKPYALISLHRDGRFIARAAEILGIGTVAGSSTRGGKEGMFRLIRLIRAGANIGITPDGPKGPAETTKLGIISLASRTGVPIYPFAYSAERHWKARSWDKLIIPKPFSRAIALLGEGISVPADISTEEMEFYRSKLDSELRALTERADQYVYTT